MKLQPLHEQPLESSILDMHGRVAWRGGDMASPSCEELIGRPCLLDDKTAACMANAIEKHFPMDIYVPSEAAEWVGLCPGGDAAKANTKLFNVVQEESPPHVFVVPGTCTQHRTSNVVAPLAKILDIICPLFCLCKAFHSANYFPGFVTALYEVIQECLDVVKARTLFVDKLLQSSC